MPRLRGWAVIAILAVVTGGLGLAARGVTENGLRFSTGLVWRFTCFAYFAVIIAEPLARLIPWQRLRRFCENRRQLIWGFCASFAAYMAGLYMCGLFAFPGRSGVMASVSGWDIFGAGLVLLISAAASPRVALFLGQKACGIVLSGGLFCFWLAYALTGLEHIVGPHRPDAFYGVSLILMIAALLLRFADHFAAQILADHNPA